MVEVAKVNLPSTFLLHQKQSQPALSAAKRAAPSSSSESISSSSSDDSDGECRAKKKQKGEPCLHPFSASGSLATVMLELAKNGLLKELARPVFLSAFVLMCSLKSRH